MDKKRFYTVFVLSNDASESKQWKVSARVFKTAAISSVLLFLALSFVVIDYARIRKHSSELHNLRKVAATQKVQLQGLSSKIVDLESQVARLNLFDKKLRIIANLDVEKESGKDSLMGMGGPTTDDDYFPSAERKTGELVERMRSELENLESRVKSQESSFTELQQSLMNKSSYLAATPSIRPTRGWMTSTYGRRISPFTGLPHMHKGIDIANRVGTPVRATADGVVVAASWQNGLGKLVVVKHGYGMKTVYGHLSETYVKPGQRVKRGDKIAAMGNTGRSTGPHLHYTVLKNGVSVNPSKYILD